MFFKKKIKCDHEWNKLLTNEEWVDTTTGGWVDSDRMKLVYIFCHKCRTREKVTLFEWQLREKEKELIQNKKSKEDESDIL